MALSIIILFLLALWHFVYDSIILPTIRLSLRYKLFALRDKLRILSSERHEEIGEDVLSTLDFAISSSINRVPYVNFTMVAQVNRMVEADIELKKKIVKRIEILKDCKVNEVRDLYDLNVRYTGLSVVVNSGAWIPYLIPVLLIAFIFKLSAVFKKRLRSKIQEVFLTPEKEIRGYYATDMDFSY